MSKHITFVGGVGPLVWRKANGGMTRACETPGRHVGLIPGKHLIEKLTR